MMVIWASLSMEGFARHTKNPQGCCPWGVLHVRQAVSPAHSAIDRTRNEADTVDDGQRRLRDQTCSISITPRRLLPVSATTVTGLPSRVRSWSPAGVRV